jgi:hypothetical protein
MENLELELLLSTYKEYVSKLINEIVLKDAVIAHLTKHINSVDNNDKQKKKSDSDFE